MEGIQVADEIIDTVVPVGIQTTEPTAAVELIEEPLPSDFPPIVPKSVDETFEGDFSPLPPVLINYARFDPSGRYFMTGVVASDSPTLQEPDVYVGKVDPEMQYHDGTGPKPKPEKPAPEYEFNYAAKAWGGDVEKLRAQKHAEIETERDRRLNDPVLNYDGILVDADAMSKQNLQDKVTATASRIAKKKVTPQQMLVWKDHDNVIHVFPDLATYKDWLDGFVIALEERGMAIWSWSWQMKDQLNALVTFEDVLNFSVAPIPAPAPSTAAVTTTTGKVL